VIHVMALVPWTPSAANVFKSAWMPAPPPLSEPAIVSATGMVRCFRTANQGGISGNALVEDWFCSGIISLMVWNGCNGKNRIFGI
jgi:hypothetical protein